MSQIKVSRIVFSSLICASLFSSLEGGEFWGKHSSFSYPEKKKTVEKPVDVPEMRVQANRLNIRQIEGGGIGYGQGYTTLETFLTPFLTFDSWLPILDLRAHRFDNGKYAFNAGAAFRFFTPSNSTIWGLNAYYDYRQAHHRNYKQVGVGFEALGARWDCRINGYIPVGSRNTGYFHTRFHKFKGHRLYVKSKREYDFAGANAEVAYHWMPSDNIDVTVALGPYYLQGKFGHFGLGAQSRLKATFINAISIEGIGSYDNHFNWKGQGQIAFSIPLGPKMKTPGISKSNSLHKKALNLRVAQPVQRFEIIAADTSKKSKVAINPATGQPYNFVFVNNDPPTAPNGTFEHAFLTMGDAQNASAPGDIIYVFAGNLYSSPDATLFTMKDNQKLWGSGINHPIKTTIGRVVIPTFTSSYPQLSNSGAGHTDFSIIQMGNNAEISGFSFPDVDVFIFQGAISGNGIVNSLIESNRFTLNGTARTSAVSFQDCSGVNTLQNNTVTIVDTQSDIGFVLQAGLPQTGIVSYRILGNTLTGTVGSSRGGVLYLPTNMNPINLAIQLVVQNNTISQFDNGVSIQVEKIVSSSVDIVSNRFQSNVNSATFTANFTGTHTVAMTGNTIVNNTNIGLLLTGDSGTTVIGQITSNNFEGSSGTASIEATAPMGSSMCLTINDNTVDLMGLLTGNLDPADPTLFLQEPILNHGAPIFTEGAVIPRGTCP